MIFPNSALEPVNFNPSVFKTFSPVSTSEKAVAIRGDLNSLQLVEEFKV
jgi:hypothetical protein